MGDRGEVHDMRGCGLSYSVLKQIGITNIALQDLVGMFW